MSLHEGAHFAVVEGTFLAAPLEQVRKLVTDDGGIVAECALPPPDASFVIAPHHAEAANPTVVLALINGRLEGWQDIPLVTVEWLRLTTQVAAEFKTLWDEYEIPKKTIARKDLDFDTAPLSASLIVNVVEEAKEEDVLSLSDVKDQDDIKIPSDLVEPEDMPVTSEVKVEEDVKSCSATIVTEEVSAVSEEKIEEDIKRPSTPAVPGEVPLISEVKVEEDTEHPSTPVSSQPAVQEVTEDITPRPSVCPRRGSEGSVDRVTSPGTHSPTSELGTTMSAPPTPTKSKNKNAQRKAARKRAKNKKKSLGELEETEGEDESTTTDQSKSPEQEPTVWDRLRNLKIKGETFTISDRFPPQTMIHLQSTNEPQHCNWCGTSHDPKQAFDIWERMASEVYPNQTIMDQLFIQNATTSRTRWERTPRREKDQPKLAWENICDLYDPASPKFFTDELFNAYLRCLNDQLQEQGVKALVLGTVFWDAVFEECIRKHPTRGPLSQFGLLRCGYTDISFGQFDRVVFPVRLGQLWSVVILDMRLRVASWYDAFGSQSCDKHHAELASRILDVLVITDPDVGSFEWKPRTVNEEYVQEAVNYSGLYAALSLEFLARQGTLNDHMLQWLLVEFRSTWHGPSVPKTVPDTWLRRAIRWVIYVCAKGTYAKDAWEADSVGEGCAGANGNAVEVMSVSTTAGSEVEA